MNETLEDSFLCWTGFDVSANLYYFLLFYGLLIYIMFGLIYVFGTIDVMIARLLFVFCLFYDLFNIVRIFFTLLIS